MNHPLPSFQFPHKPLKLTKIAQSFAMQLFLGLAMLIGAAGIFWWQSGVVQEIYRDYQIGRNPQVLADADISGECETRKAVFTDCEVTIRDGGTTRKKEFMFFSAGSGDYSVQAVASADNPDWVTLDLAIDKIGNRSIFAAFFIAVALLMLWGGAYVLFAGIPRQRKVIAPFNEAHAQPWQFAEVHTVSNGNKYVVDIDGTPRKIVLNFGKNRPWVIGGDDKEPVLLGIAPKNGGNPVPLDQKLSSVSGLGKEERQALIAEIHRHYG